MGQLTRPERRKLWRPLFLVATALAVGAIAGNWTRAQEAEAPAATELAAAAESPAAPAPSLPDYYDGHATDTNGDGDVDEKEAAVNRRRRFRRQFRGTGLDVL